MVTAISQCAASGCQLHVLAALQIVLGKEFEADHVYLPTDGDAIYEDEVVGLVGSLYEGINCTVFAYGEPASLQLNANTQPTGGSCQESCSMLSAASEAGMPCSWPACCSRMHGQQLRTVPASITPCCRRIGLRQDPHCAGL